MAQYYIFFENNIMQSENVSNLTARLPPANLLGYIVGLFLLLFSVVCNASVTLSKEDKLKAAYLLNFTQFIEWPVVGENQSLSSIRICVEESAEFMSFLSDMAKGPRFKKREPKVESLIWDTASRCDLMYLTSLKNVDLVDLTNVVIVVNSRDTYFPGATIVFYEDEKKLRFEIDLNCVYSLEVNFSSQLLKLAKIRK